VKINSNHRQFAFLAISAILVVIFLRANPIRRAASLDDDQFFEAVISSASFKTLQQRVNKLVAMKDSDDGTFVVFNIGEDFPDHFVLIETLRVERQTGKVAKECVDDKLELYWKEELFTPCGPVDFEVHDRF